MKSFYSNGKLFILGEYYVLNGAKVFALPTKFGQYLHVKSANNQTINWTSFDADKTIWYKETFLINDVLKNNQSFSNPVTNTLINILHEAHKANSEILKNGYEVKTELTFNKNWGLGTSSTLINNIAQWFNINAFNLLKQSFGGSGYDIACAQNNTPITYQIKNGEPVINNVTFKPEFTHYLYFVYLNQKRNSTEAIANFKRKQKNLEAEIKKVSEQTDKIIQETDFEAFCKLLIDYENNLSLVLETPTIKKQLFNDFNGVIKSLGAWGGDFVLVASKNDPTDYFKSKGYNTILPYKEMIL